MTTGSPGPPRQDPPPDAWETTGRWFQRLVQLSARERTAELDRILAEEPSLARELETLLEAHDRWSPLDRPPRRLRDIVTRLRRGTLPETTDREPPA